MRKEDREFHRQQPRHREDDDREVGTASKHRENPELPTPGTHVSEEEPRSRLLGDYSGRPVEQIDNEEDEIQERAMNELARSSE